MNLQVHGRLRSHQRNALFPPDPAITPTNPLRCKTKFRSATDISRWFHYSKKPSTLVGDDVWSLFIVSVYSDNTMFTKAYSPRLLHLKHDLWAIITLRRE